MLWINKDYIKRLVGRFQLELTPKGPESLPFYPVVMPVTNVDEILIQTKVDELFSGDPGSAGLVEIHEVPTGKRQKFRAVELKRISGSTLTFDELSVNIGVYRVPVADWTASADHVLYLNPAFPLPEGATLQVNIIGYTGGDVLRIRALFDEEDAY